MDSGVDPSLFSQTLMYHAHRYAKNGWAGEPEIDPTQEYEEREQVEGWELKPMECMDLAHGGVLRERAVVAGPYSSHLRLLPSSVLILSICCAAPGSSTACIVNLNASTGALRAAKYVSSHCCLLIGLIVGRVPSYSLGDSGFCVIRSSSVIHFQEPQTHYFNCPRYVFLVINCFLCIFVLIVRHIGNWPKYPRIIGE